MNKKAVSKKITLHRINSKQIVEFKGGNQVKSKAEQREELTSLLTKERENSEEKVDELILKLNCSTSSLCTL